MSILFAHRSVVGVAEPVDVDVTGGGLVVPVVETEPVAAPAAVASLPVGAGRDDPAVERFLKAMSHVQTVQRTGSAALNLSYVACGRIDAFWSTSLKPWDMAAGALVVTEAGGTVTKLDGECFDVNVPDLLATNGKAIHAELQRVLAS